MKQSDIVKYIFASILLLAFVLGASQYGKYATPGPFIAIAMLAGAVMAAVTFTKPENGLKILVFAMLLSPEIPLMELPKRTLAVRIEDLFIIVMFLAWLAHTATDKDWKGFVKTPLDFPLLLLFSVYVTSTALGIIDGRINAFKSLFYVLKYFEYFIIYWSTVNILHFSTNEELSGFVLAGFITSLIVALYAYSIMGDVARVSAPFDSDGAKLSGESASLGGYMVIIISLAFSFYMIMEKKPWMMLLYMVFLMPPFVRTLSRASFYAIGPALFSVLVLAPKRKIKASIIILLGIVLFPVLAPDLNKAVTNRMNETFNTATTREYSVGGNNIAVEESAAQRIENWKLCFNEWLPAHPLLGAGITGVGLVDSQIPLYLGEIGIIGFAVFVFVLLKIAWIAFLVLRNSSDSMEQALSLGLLGTLVGLMVQSIAVNTFIIIRIMEPFWFLVALVVGVFYSRYEKPRPEPARP